jgi:hypothetical protein
MTAPRSRSRQSKQLDAGIFQAEISSFALRLAAEGKAAKTIQTYTEAVQWFAAACLPGRRLRGRRGESSSLDQAAEILDRSGADYTPSDPAVRGDHERAGEGADGNEPVKLSRDKVARVTQAWVEKPVLLHVGLRAGRVVRHVDTDELDAR